VTGRKSSSSSCSSQSNSEDELPLARLKRPPRETFQESSDKESSQDDEDEKVEEEEDGSSDEEEPWGGAVDDDVLPPSLHLVWDGGKIVKDFDPSNGGRIWRCNHCKNQWSGWNHTKALGHAIGGGRTSGDARVCLLNGGSYTWGLLRGKA